MKRAVIFLFLGVLACDGNGDDKNCLSTRDTFQEMVVCDSVEAPKNIRFVLSGTAACNDCLNNDFPVAGLYVNVFPADASQLDVLDPIATTMTGGLGPFELRLTGVEGMRLRIDGQLYRESESISNPATLESSEEITVPSKNDEIVTFTINFSQG